MERNFKVAEIQFSQIPKQFNISNPHLLCIRDLIAYVRSEIEVDPWVPVVLRVRDKSDVPFGMEVLEGNRIYWEGVNDKRVNSIHGLSVDSYFVVKASQLDINKDDCGIEKLAVEFEMTYDVRSFSILVTGTEKEDKDVLVKLRNFILDDYGRHVILPRFIVIQTKLRENGINISPYAAKISYRRDTHELDIAWLRGLLADLDKEVVAGLTCVQDLEEDRTLDVRLLTLYLTLKYNLPPTDLPCFIAEYLELQFYYPYRQLSLKERLDFLYKLPPLVGYLGIISGFNCYANIVRKIYPSPHYVFNLKTMELEPDPSQFKIDVNTMGFLDFRDLFPGSKMAITPEDTSSLVAVKGKDEETNQTLVDLFTALGDLVPDEDIFISIKNSVCVQRNGVRYLLYCPEECGVEAILISEYFGKLQEIITEKDFFRFIDAQIERALLHRFRTTNVQAGNKALVASWKQIDVARVLQPAIPFEVSLFSKMLPANKNGLSYYDNMLRCCVDILPIVTSIDSPLRDVNPLFNSLKLKHLRKDPESSKVINAFGTLNNVSSQKSDITLPVTLWSFREGGLL